MKLSSPSRIIAVALAIFSMLFMQLALAAYVCPGVTQGEATVTSASMAMDMPGCDGMDMEQPVLCHAHAQDQASKQTLDKPDLPLVTPFIASALVQMLVLKPVLISQNYPAIAAQLSTHSSTPPVTILHCCFRL